MKISYNWLKNYLTADIAVDRLTEILTDIGLEVDSLVKTEIIPGGLEGVLVGEVLSCGEHPDSDHLHITTVDVGTAEPLQIVCGAPNVAAGQKVLVATVNATLHPAGAAEGFKIRKSKIRGVESSGMICAEDELGIGESHDGIMVLDPGARPGTPAREYLGLHDDYTIEIGLTPNRIDAASHYGVARDLVAWLKTNHRTAELILPSVADFRQDNDKREITVKVENGQAAPRYAGLTISNVTAAPSPEWLQRNLRAIGINPKNNIVDITNFVLHEVGQPLHAFDADRIEGGQVVVRTCPEGTKFTTLDGVERTLSDRDLMICDASGPMCIAGVLGGAESGVTESTKTVFLESACFNPLWVRKSAKRHGVNTDASFRFERGVDPNITIYALRRAAMLIRELAGGEISSPVTDIISDSSILRPFRFEFSLDRFARLAGKEIPEKTIREILAALGIEVERVGTDMETGDITGGPEASGNASDTDSNMATKNAAPHASKIAREADADGTAIHTSESTSEADAKGITTSYSESVLNDDSDGTATRASEDVTYAASNLTAEDASIRASEATSDSVRHTRILSVAVPPFRVDVRREADLAEEILRLYGYNNIEIPQRVHSTLAYTLKPDKEKIADMAADYLSAGGFMEIMSNSLTRSAYYDNLSSFRPENCVKIINPLSADLNVMRQTLLFNMMEAVSLNVNHRNPNLRMYELGKVYAFDPDISAAGSLAPYSETFKLAMAITGQQTLQSWNTGDVRSNFFHLKGMIERLLRKLGLDFYSMETEYVSNDIYSEGLSVKMKGKSRELFNMGAVSGNLRRMFDTKQDVWFMEMNFDQLLKSLSVKDVTVSDLPKFPEVRRDLAMLVDRSVTFADLRTIAFGAERKILRNVTLFDVYEGDKLPEGKKSYALGFILQDESQTLTDKIIERTMNNLIRQFENKAGATVRR